MIDSQSNGTDQEHDDDHDVKSTIAELKTEIENFQNLCLKYEKNITELKKYIDFDIQNKILNLKLNKQLQEKLDEHLNIFQKEKKYSIVNFQELIHEKINNNTVDNYGMLLGGIQGHFLQELSNEYY
jgi:hypothetical protein